MNEVSGGQRLHIGFFGRRNVGKSSLVNRITNQEMSLVSEVKGTTTDPVRKSMELLPLGPVVVIDTPGLDDEGLLGEERIRRSKKTFSEIDIAVVVLNVNELFSEYEDDLMAQIKQRNLPYLIVCNKCDDDSYNKTDINTKITNRWTWINTNHIVLASAKNHIGIEEIKNRFELLNKQDDKKVVADLIEPGDVVILVIPVDESAPKGRLILPQQLVLREILDFNGIAICCQDTELGETLAKLASPPKLVITDSQAFEKVALIVPDDIMLTSFSVLMARYKGDLESLLSGVKRLASLKSGDRVLIAEACTHHRQCNDIGTVKIPKWVEKFTKADLVYEFSSGLEFPEDLSSYQLIIHCGGCMINETSMKHRIHCAQDVAVPIVNYGMAIAEMNGILQRCMQPLVNMTND